MARQRRKAKSEAFVLDCSLTLAWFFEDESNAYAQAVEYSLTRVSALVPSLWALEVANALLMGERRKRTTEAKVTSFLGLLKLLPIAADDETAIQAWQESMHLARAQQLSVYDAAYLELALRQGLPLATLDEKLRRAADAIGILAFEA